MSALERPLAVLLTIVALTTNSRQFICIAAASFSSFSSPMVGAPSNAAAATSDSIGDGQRMVAPLDLIRLLHNSFLFNPQPAMSSDMSSDVNGIDCGPSESVSSSIVCRGGHADGGQSDRKLLADNDTSGRRLQSLPTPLMPFQTKPSSLTSIEAFYRGTRRSRPSRPLGQRQLSSLPSTFSQLPSSIMSGIAARSGELTSIRNRFTPWGGKRASLSKSDDYDGRAAAAAAKRGGFQPWGGKRDPISSDGWQKAQTRNDDDAGDQPWAMASPTSADDAIGNESKRGFHPWGGK